MLVQSSAGAINCWCSVVPLDTCLGAYLFPTHARCPRLERRQAEGYTLLGLEQTSESVRLPDYTFPAKAVLVLGREKEGLPQEVRRQAGAGAAPGACTASANELRLHVHAWGHACIACGVARNGNEATSSACFCICSPGVQHRSCTTCC